MILGMVTLEYWLSASNLNTNIHYIAKKKFMRKFVLIFIIIPSILIAQNDVNEVVVIKSDKQIEKFASSLE